MPVVELPAIVICDDVGRAPAPLCLEELAGRLRRELPAAAVVTVAGLCGSPEAVSGALAGTGRKRVVLGCRDGSAQRGDLLAGLRRAGIPAGAADIVDLRPAAAPGGTAVDELTVLEQSVALLCASAALVSAADLEVPTPERTNLFSGKVSRRSLLRGANVVRQPVAVWQAGRCEGRAACTACVLACPQGALSRESGRLVVSAELCNACGACVSACRSGAFALAGAGLEALAAAAGVLVENVARGVGATGIAIACRHSRSAPRPGERWLALRVPSLEMVTAGWLLGLVSAGVETRVVACEDDRCEARGGDLGDFLVVLQEALGHAAALSGLSPVLRRVAADPGPVIELREPEATMRSLEALGSLRPGQTAWRADGAGCPLGEMRIDPVACSFCEVCAGACPTGALAARHDESGSRSLSFDPGCCTACGACEACCPERALETVRGMDGASLAAGRRILATRPALASCSYCGAPLDAGLSAAALSRAASRDTIGPVTARICADCRLGGRTVRSRRTG